MEALVCPLPNLLVFFEHLGILICQFPNLLVLRNVTHVRNCQFPFKIGIVWDAGRWSAFSQIPQIKPKDGGDGANVPIRFM